MMCLLKPQFCAHLSAQSFAYDTPFVPQTGLYCGKRGQADTHLVNSGDGVVDVVGTCEPGAAGVFTLFISKSPKSNCLEKTDTVWQRTTATVIRKYK